MCFNLIKMIENSRRKDALEWWRNMTIEVKNGILDKWKKDVEEDSRKDWSNDMISSSSSTIESIYIKCIQKNQ